MSDMVIAKKTQKHKLHKHDKL